MDTQTKEVIRKTIEELLQRMGFPATVNINEDTEEGSLSCNITTENDSNFLIGQHGVNLQAMQHLSRLMVRKQIPEKIRFTLDVNGYRQQKNQSIMEQAVEAANKAIAENRTVIMNPMSNYERRIAHLELSKNEKVKSESTGEGEDRKIVVKPLGLL